MDTLINLLVEILYLMKYSKIFNSKRFVKEMPFYKEASDTESASLKQFIYEQLDRLKKNISGTPTICLLDKKPSGLYKVIIVNEENKFCCRLEDSDVGGFIDYEKCLVHL